MTQEEWAIVAALGQAVAAACAVGALFFVGVQIRAARKATDLKALQEFLRSAVEREEKLLSAPTTDARVAAFSEFLNFLEVSAAALNGGLFPETSRRMVHEKIRDSLAVIAANSVWQRAFEDAITTSDTFSELKRFRARNCGAIERVTSDLKTLQDAALPAARTRTSKWGRAWAAMVSELRAPAR